MTPLCTSCNATDSGHWRNRRHFKAAWPIFILSAKLTTTSVVIDFASSLSEKSLTALFSLSLFSIMGPFVDSEIRRRCQYNGSTKSIQSDGNYQPYVDDHFLNCCPCYEGLQYLTQRPALKWDHCQHSSRQTQYLSVSKVHTVLKNKYAYCIHGLWVHVSPIILCWLAFSHRLSEQLLKNLS